MSQILNDLPLNRRTRVFFANSGMPSDIAVVFKLVMLALLPLSGFPTLANSSDAPENIDQLGFDTTFDNHSFSNGFVLQGENQTVLGAKDRSTVSTTLEVESKQPQPIGRIKPLQANFDSLALQYQSQGLKIKRLSTSWQSDYGSITVGNDWANFQDTLNLGNRFNDALQKRDRSVASQIRWLSPNGFSISIEDNDATPLLPIGIDEESNAGLDAPSIILSWQGGDGEQAGQYKVTAMGTKLDSQIGEQRFAGENVIGWGLNLEGGWQIGDLFAALSVTYGKGINSYVLQRFGDEIRVTSNEVDGDAYSIKPSLYYSLNENSNLHVVLGRYSFDDSDPVSDIDTLDTIHMGYSWSPWSSTQLGLELVGQNIEGPRGEKEDTQVKFGAQKSF